MSKKIKDKTEIVRRPKFEGPNAKRDRFVHYANIRVNGAVRAIHRVENLFNSVTYAYTENDVNTILNALEVAISNLKSSAEPKAKEKTIFKIVEG